MPGFGSVGPGYTPYSCKGNEGIQCPRELDYTV